MMRLLFDILVVLCVLFAVSIVCLGFSVQLFELTNPKKPFEPVSAARSDHKKYK